MNLFNSLPPGRLAAFQLTVIAWDLAGTVSAQSVAITAAATTVLHGLLGMKTPSLPHDAGQVGDGAGVGEATSLCRNLKELALASIRQLQDSQQVARYRNRRENVHRSIQSAASREKHLPPRHCRDSGHRRCRRRGGLVSFAESRERRDRSGSGARA
jgi:cystathionine beta-lyase/cystathionine gamma-synthase